jgi:hypothetical protein
MEFKDGVINHLNIFYGWVKHIYKALISKV